MIDTVGAAPSGRRELDLTPDRIPRTLWVAAGIPVFTTALVLWLTMHWQDLTYRGYVDDADWLWRRGARDSMIRGVLGFLVFEMWIVAYGLAYWYGAPRTNPRDAMFNLAVANAWFMALWIPAIQFSVTLELSWRGIALCVTMAIVGLAALVLAARRARHIDTGAYASGRVYFDRQDPALIGTRGINLGNPWHWALLAAGLSPSAAIALLAWIQFG